MVYNGIYQDVERLIAKHKTRDPKEILEDRGVYVKPFKENTRLLGMFKRILDDKFVFYNTKINDYNLRMVLAHELGHEFYHGHESFCGNELFGVINSKEVEANIFAAHLLINDNSIKEYITLGYNIQQMASLECVDKNLLIIKLNDLMRMRIIPRVNLYNRNDFFRDISGCDRINWANEYNEDYI